MPELPQEYRVKEVSLAVPEAVSELELSCWPTYAAAAWTPRGVLSVQSLELVLCEKAFSLQSAYVFCHALGPAASSWVQPS
jgi:hypothetical protein